jgi:hypothetical protein
MPTHHSPKVRLRHDRGKMLRIAALCVTLQVLTAAPLAVSQTIQNLTGLPAYPHLRSATMERIPRTDVLGHWCYRLMADSYDSLDAVQDWYRKALAGASESDLTHDPSYKAYTDLSGIKLSIDLDYADIYRSEPQAITSITLVKCSPVT